MINKSISTNKIAEICGVSQGTVDRALNNRKGINPKTKEHILKIAKEYGYKPNIHARAIAGGKSMLIGIIVFDLDNRYFTEFITHFEKHCASLGYSIITMFTDKSKEREIECINTLCSMSVDGIVICPINKGTDYERFLLSLDTTVVTIGNKLENIAYVGINNENAMFDVTEHVISKGHKELIYVMPSEPENQNFSAQKDRLSGFLKAATKHSVSFRIFGIDEALNLTAEKSTGTFICATDAYAIRLSVPAKQQGFSIIGFDNTDLIDKLLLGFDSLSADTDAVAKGAFEYIASNTPSPHIKYSIICRGSV